MVSTASLSLLQSYRQATTPNPPLLAIAILVSGEVAMVADMFDVGDMWGLNSELIFCGIVVWLLMAMAFFIIWEIRRAGKAMAYFKTLSDAELEALLLAPATDGIWTAGLQTERARRMQSGTA